MKVAINFDGCFEAMPNLFRSFIEAGREEGHKFWIVTNRDIRQKKFVEDVVLTKDFAIDIMVCGPKPKRDYMQEHGINIDIWIDDKPESIIMLSGDLK